MKIFSTFIVALFAFNSLLSIGNAPSEIEAKPPCKGEILNSDIYKYISYGLPTALIIYGLIGIESDGLKSVNAEFQEEILEHIDDQTSYDDFAQFAPSAFLYILEPIGINPRHGIGDKTIVLTQSMLTMGLVVNSIKYTARVERPDKTTKNSFPSGHTATAFVGAEMMFQEYCNESLILAFSGYLIAGSVAYFRMHNDRHWFTDISAGAGIGILCAKLSYLCLPQIKSIVPGKEKLSMSITPDLNCVIVS